MRGYLHPPYDVAILRRRDQKIGNLERGVVVQKPVPEPAHVPGDRDRHFEIGTGLGVTVPDPGLQLLLGVVPKTLNGLTPRIVGSQGPTIVRVDDAAQLAQRHLGPQPLWLRSAHPVAERVHDRAVLLQ